MKRFRILGPHLSQLEEFEPEAIEAKHLLVAPLLTGICGTDLEILEGTMAYFRLGRGRFPITPGHEWVGRVEAVGRSVTKFAEGDIVVGECSVGCDRCSYCASGRYHQCPDRQETGILNLDGALTERMAFPARAAHRVPPGMSLEDAALVEPTAVAYRALQRLQAPRGSRVLVVGGGTIGYLTAALLIADGESEVSMLTGGDHQMRRAAELGVRQSTGSEFFEYAVETAGRTSSITAARSQLSPGGRMVVAGLTGHADMPFPIDDLVVGDQTVVGTVGSPGVWPEVLRLIARGAVSPSRIISNIFELEDAAAAYGLLAARKPETGKVLVRSNL